MANILILGITRNRGPIAKIFTEVLFDQVSAIPDSTFDVVIYENDSTDNTVSEFETAFQSKPANVNSARIVSETLKTESFGSVASEERINQIANARNRAMESAGDLSQYDCVVWVDTDYLIHEGVLENLVSEVLDDNYDIVSAYSLHADIQRPPNELFDKWATRNKSSDVWWCCTPVEMLPGIVDVYSTFNGLAVFNAKGFKGDGPYFSSKSESSIENGTGFDVEWVGVCEMFRSQGLSRIGLDTDSRVYHFMNASNIASADLNLIKNKR